MAQHRRQNQYTSRRHDVPPRSSRTGPKNGQVPVRVGDVVDAVSVRELYDQDRFEEAEQQAVALWKRGIRPEVLVGLLADSPALRKRVASDPNTDPDVLRAIAECLPAVPHKERGRVARRLLKNPSIDTATIQMLAARFRGRQNVLLAAQHLNCPPDLLTSFRTEAWVAIRVAVAQHPNCPPDTLTFLALEDSRREVQRTALTHPNCPPETAAASAFKT